MTKPLLLFVLMLCAGCDSKDCSKWHTEREEAWTEVGGFNGYVWSQRHPAKDVIICDVWKESVK